MSSTTYTVSGMTCEHLNPVLWLLMAPASPMMPLMQPSGKLDTLSCVEA